MKWEARNVFFGASIGAALLAASFLLGTVFESSETTAAGVGRAPATNPVSAAAPSSQKLKMQSRALVRCQELLEQYRDEASDSRSRYTLLSSIPPAVVTAKPARISPTGKTALELFGSVLGLPPGLTKLIPEAAPAQADQPPPMRWLIKGKIQPYVISGDGRYFYLDPQTSQVQGPFEPENAQ